MQQRQMTYYSEMVSMVRKARCPTGFLARNCQNECMGNTAGKSTQGSPLLKEKARWYSGLHFAHVNDCQTSKN